MINEFWVKGEDPGRTNTFKPCKINLYISMKFQSNYCLHKISVWNNSFFRIQWNVKLIPYSISWLEILCTVISHIFKNEEQFPPVFMQVKCRSKGKICTWICLQVPQSYVQRPAAFIGGLCGKMIVLRFLGELEDSSYPGFVREGAASFRSNQFGGCI